MTNPAPSIITNSWNGPKSERINIVVLGDGYTSNQFASFQASVTNIVMQYLLSSQPYSSYKSYFNVFSINTASLQSGSDHPLSSITKDTYFNSTFDTSGIDRLLTVQNTTAAYNLLSQLIPEYELVIVIVNDTTYGGSGGAFAVTSVNGSAPDIAIHEIGHSYGGLTDEYSTTTPGYSPSERVNCSAVTNRTTNKWRVWIDAATPVPTPYSGTYASTPGIFEGCMYTNNNWYRPHYDSFMRTLARPTGQINSDQIVKRIYRKSPYHISPFRAVTPASNRFSVANITNLNFIVSPLQPTDHSLQVQWYKDGTNLTGETGTNLAISSLAVSEGTHVISGAVWDATSLVRIYTNSEYPANPLIKYQTWTVDVSNQRFTIQANAGPGGTVSPSGTVSVVPYSTTNFLVTSAPYYYIASIATNGIQITVPDPTNVLITFTGISCSGALTSSFSAYLATNNTPLWWLHSCFPAETDLAAAAVSDTDGDHVPAWAEYLAGTDPNSSSSALRIVAATPTGETSNVICWNSVTGRTYNLLRSTNLLADPAFSNLLLNIPGQPGTTAVTDSPPATARTFYYSINVNTNF